MHTKLAVEPQLIEFLEIIDFEHMHAKLPE